MSHTELILYNQEAMQKGFRFEMKRMVDVILRSGHHRSVRHEHAAENVSGPYMLHIGPNRLEYFLDNLIGNQTLPIQVVFVHVLLEVVVGDGPIVSPRISAEQF